MHVRAEVLVKATVKTIMSVVKYAGYLKCGTFMKSDKEVVVFVVVLGSRTVESQSTRSSIMVGSRVSDACGFVFHWTTDMTTILSSYQGYDSVCPLNDINAVNIDQHQTNKLMNHEINISNTVSLSLLWVVNCVCQWFCG